MPGFRRGHNRLGSIRDIIDTSANVKDSIGYDGFGGISSETDNSFRGRYAWTAREVDTETSLQYNRARYYDAGTGRWISQDPLGFDAGDSNLFRYLMNGATSGTDPSGLAPQLEANQVYEPFGGHGGVFFWSRNWTLTEAAHALCGGYVLEQVQISFEGNPQLENGATWQVNGGLNNGNFNYWLLWRVKPGSTEATGGKDVKAKMNTYLGELNLLSVQGNKKDKDFYKGIRKELLPIIDAVAKKNPNDSFYFDETFTAKGIRPAIAKMRFDNTAWYFDHVAPNDLPKSFRVGFTGWPGDLRQVKLGSANAAAIGQDLVELNAVALRNGGSKSSPVVAHASIDWNALRGDGSRTIIAVS